MEGLRGAGCRYSVREPPVSIQQSQLGDTQPKRLCGDVNYLSKSDIVTDSAPKYLRNGEDNWPSLARILKLA